MDICGSRVRLAGPLVKSDPMIQVSRYGHAIWMSALVIWTFSLTDITIGSGLTVCSLVRCVAQLEWSVLGHRCNISLVRLHQRVESITITHEIPRRSQW